MDNLKIIDSHIHYRPDYQPFSKVAENSGSKNTALDVQKMLKENNIVHAVVMGNLSLELENHIYPPNMSYCVGLDSSVFKNPDKPQDYYISLVEEHLKRESCVGIKLYPGYCPTYVTDEVYYPFYELAEKYNKPVAIHTGALSQSRALLKYSHPLTLDEAAVRFRNVKFVMCHFGNPFLAEAASVAQKNRNVFVDISGILEGDFNVNDFFAEFGLYADMLKTWLKYFGDFDRVMYGSDWPIVNMSKYIQFVKGIIPEKHWEKAFYLNAANIYNIKA